MAQIVIDVNGTPTLFSPVPAHALHRGDLIHIGGGVAVRVVSTAREGAQMRITDTGDTYHLPVNFSVPRAVGANSGCGGSR